MDPLRLRAKAGERGSRLAAMAAGLLVCGALVAAFHDRSWYPPDEGAYADVARRMLAGEGLNREVGDLHAGYVNLINAAAMALFGERLVSLRYPLALVSLLQAALILYLFRRRDPWLGALAAVAGLALGVLGYLDPTAHWYALAVFYLTVLVLHEVPAGRRWRLPLAGGLVVTLFLFRQLSGVLVAIGVVAYLLLEAAGQEGRRPRSAVVGLLAYGTMAVGLAAYLASTTDWGGFLLFGLGPLALLLAAAMQAPVPSRRVAGILAGLALGGVAALLPLVVFHLAQGSLGSWLEDTVYASLAQSRSGFLASRRFVAGLLPAAAHVVFAGLGARAAVNGLFWLLLAFAALLLGGLVLRALLRGRAVEPLPWLTVFYAVVTLHHQNSTYLFFTAGATVVGLLWLAAGRGARWRAAAAVGVAGLAAVGLVFQAGQSHDRDVFELVTGVRGPVVEAVGLPRCGLRIHPDELARYRRLVGLIRAESAPGATIFAVPNHPELYFLAERRNPFRFFNLGFGVYRPEHLAEVLDTLSREPPSLVIYDPSDKYNDEASRRVMALVRARYEPLARVERFEVYRRP